MSKALWKINEDGRPSFVDHVSPSYRLKKNEFYGTSPKGKWKNVNKPGDEPDYLKFKYKGYTCEIKRTSLSLLHLCGYVTLDRNNKLYGKKWDDEEIENLEVHGGITFAEPTKKGKWQIGFDCAHYDDVLPGTDVAWGIEDSTYKDMWFVKSELIKLVDQIDYLNTKKDGHSNDSNSKK